MIVRALNEDFENDIEREEIINEDLMGIPAHIWLILKGTSILAFGRLVIIPSQTKEGES